MTADYNSGAINIESNSPEPWQQTSPAITTMTTESVHPAPTTMSHTGARQRAAVREMSQRRRRVWMNVVFFVVATAGMLALSLITRDSHAFKRSEAFAQELTQHLNENYSDRRLPSDMPMPGDMSAALRESWRSRYCYLGQKPRREAILKKTKRAVCYPVYPLRMYLRSGGRHVILATPDGFEYQWLSEAEIKQQADKLGIVLIKPPGQ